MKSIVSFLSTFALLLSFAHQSLLNAQSLPPFEEVILSGNISALLIEGDEESIEIDDHSDELKYEVEGRALKVSSKNIIKHNSPATQVIIKYVHLRTIRARAGAAVSSQQPLEAEAIDLRFTSGSTGKLTLESRSLSVKVSEGSNLNIRGAADFMEGRAATGGSLSAYELDCNDIVFKTNTGGLAKVTAKGTIKATAKTGGSIVYKGEPKKVIENDGLSGTIKAYH